MMSFAVGIACLMVVAVLGEVASTPNKQPLVKDESQIEDGSSIILREDLEGDLKELELHTKSIKKKKTKLHCKIAGGQCEHKKKECHDGYGWCIAGNDYCHHHEHYCCCVPPPKKGCVFGDDSYPHKAFITKACIRILCLDGVWDFNVNETNPECGLCTASPGTNVNTYVPHDIDSNIVNSYNYTVGGFSKYFFTKSYDPGQIEDFGCLIHLDRCIGNTTDLSCVVCFTYYQLGIEVLITFTRPIPGSFGRVFVDSKEVIMENNSARSFYATSGTVLVYKESSTCYYLVGSKGLSVRLWTQYIPGFGYYATLDVWAIPSLKYQLQGMCDVFKPETPTCYTYSNGSCLTDTDEFCQSWKV